MSNAKNIGIHRKIQSSEIHIEEEYEIADEDENSTDKFQVIQKIQLNNNAFDRSYPIDQNKSSSVVSQNITKKSVEHITKRSEFEDQNDLNERLNQNMDKLESVVKSNKLTKLSNSQEEKRHEQLKEIIIKSIKGLSDAKKKEVQKVFGSDMGAFI